MPRRAIKPEAAVQKAVLDLLAAERVYALRLNTIAVRTREGRPLWSHSGGPGVADIVAFPHIALPVAEMRRQVAVLWIECKSPDGRQTPQQREFQSDMTGRGMHYLLARGPEDVYRWLQEHR